MKAYVGQTRSTKLVERLRDLGIGECTQRGEMPPRRQPWFHDNGAFRDWTLGRPFNGARWLRDMSKLATDLEFGKVQQPDFVVVPDIVAGGIASLEMSEAWRQHVPLVCPSYLVVQDGMTPALVARYLAEVASEHGEYDGIFIGGSLTWKLDNAESWVAFAHKLNMRCHIGRVGTAFRVKWAHHIGADSIDSSLPLFHLDDNLVPFLNALREVNAL